MKKPVVGIALIALVTIAALAGGYWWTTSRQRTEVLRQALPPTPDLAAWPDEFPQRVSECEAAVQAGHDPETALGNLSRLYHANGFYAEAIHCYVALEYLEPGNPEWPHRHAVILSGFGDAEGALQLLRRVTRLSPDYLPARIRSGDLLLKQSRYDDAREAYQEVLDRSPNESHALLGLARCEFEAGDWESARVILEKVVGQTNYRLGYDLIVTVYQQLGLESRAEFVRAKQKASGAYRDPPDPWMELLHQHCYDVYRLTLIAGEAADRGNPKAAIRYLERGLSFAPQSASLHFQLALTLQDVGDLDQARHHLERCTDLDPDFADGWAYLSGLLTRLGRPAEADRVLATGLARCPDSPGLHLMNARRLKQAGDVDGAIREYQVSIALRPNEADASIELASLLFDLNRIEEGVARLQEALAAEPENPIALSTVSPASEIFFRRSERLPPFLTKSRSVGIHGSMAS